MGAFYSIILFVYSGGIGRGSVRFIRSVLQSTTSLPTSNQTIYRGNYEGINTGSNH